MVLAELKPGQTAIIEAFENKALALKLMELGIIAGEEIRFDSVAPFGGPIAVEVAGSKISMRKKEAMTVKIRLN